VVAEVFQIGLTLQKSLFILHVKSSTPQGMVISTFGGVLPDLKLTQVKKD